MNKKPLQRVQNTTNFQRPIKKTSNILWLKYAPHAAGRVHAATAIRERWASRPKQDTFQPRPLRAASNNGVPSRVQHDDTSPMMTASAPPDQHPSHVKCTLS